jgi:hypothetical protein
MNRGAWVGGLVLSLGGWVPGLVAQDAWRPAGNGPFPVALGPNDLQPLPLAVSITPGPSTGQTMPAWAVLERPVAVADEPIRRTYFEVSLTPPIIAAAYHPTTLPDIQPVPAVTVSRPVPEPEAAEEPSLFASDRLAAPPRPAPTVTPAAAEATTPSPPPAPAPTLASHPGVLPDAIPIIPADPDGVPAVDPFKKNFYFIGEYLLWTTRQDKVPPLVSTSSPADMGILGRPSTQVLFGGSLDRGAQNGMRLTAGYWLDMYCTEAVEASGFFLGRQSSRFAANSDNLASGVLARPFFNVNFQREDSEQVAFPGISRGTVQVDAPSDLWGVELNMRCNLCKECNYRVDLLAGPRILHLGESVDIAESIQAGPNAPAPFTNQLVSVADRFATDSYFIGFQLGLAGEYNMGPWSFSARGKLALGGNYDEINIRGIETLSNGLGTLQLGNRPGGLLALGSNIGSQRQGDFAIVPELTLSVGYQVTEHLRALVGYNLLYWTGVVRPGGQIDRNLNQNLIPNFPAAPLGSGLHPSVPFKETDFWAQGLTVGIEYRY